MSKVTPNATLEPSASGSRLGLVSEGFHRLNSTERQLSSIIIGFMEVVEGTFGAVNSEVNQTLLQGHG